MEHLIKVAIVDDQALIREGLATMIDLRERFQVVIQAKNGVHLLDMIHIEKVDLILLDIQMPEMDGMETLKALKKIECMAPIIMLTTFVDEQYILEAMRLGAAGYVLKDIEIDELILSMERVLNGHMVFPQSVQLKLMEQLSSQHKMSVRIKEELQEHDIYINEREEEMLQLMALGYSNQRIAEEIYLSIGTIKNYSSKLYEKLGVKNRAELVSYLHQLLNI
ncbi:response regulator transcription factor [Halalkalibacter hemicellulosilyticus]|uniref:Two-component response regulator n=1 Tax=Halalkalibacter hemicellulosilyticusJCM 9152 TaxID=1236971 RepID=W4QLR7_9BACI|nr:response regulator transcription factor [Halalkalibacter hemicellulosilyticus]GAE32583.1 two-component response regulator [Halalkalibacter hemicellulosilyticusJCM 9152]